jgi:ferritin-like protein
VRKVTGSNPVRPTKTNKNVSINQTLDEGEIVPSEILDAEKFVEISGRAEYCAVKRLKDVVKLKLRTPNTLYTLKVEPAKAAEIIKRLQCEIHEI